MKDYNYDKIERYREYLKDEIAGCEKIADCDNLNDESRKDFWYRRTALKFALEEFDRMFPPPVYLPPWVKYLCWGLYALISLSLLVIGFIGLHKN
jgi:hypothetical protein